MIAAVGIALNDHVPAFFIFPLTLLAATRHIVRHPV